MIQKITFTETGGFSGIRVFQNEVGNHGFLKNFPIATYVAVTQVLDTKNRLHLSRFFRS